VRNAAHRRAFKVGLETDEIAVETIDHESDILWCHGGVGHIIEREKIGGVGVTGEDSVGEWEEREVSTNVVRRRVEPDLVFEPSRADLVVVR
jgi:uncharacterized protein GlcG (DUF336 family)